jgi:putative intracellular protease/amidase
MWENNKIVASVSHGPSALLSAKSSSGCWIFHNKRLTGLSNEEEKMTGHMDEVPFLVEDTMKDLGGIWEAGTAWSVSTSFECAKQ